MLGDQGVKVTGAQDMPSLWQHGAPARDKAHVVAIKGRATGRKALDRGAAHAQVSLATWTEEQLTMATGVQLPAPAPSAGWGLAFGRRAKPRRGDELPDADWVVRHGLPMRSAYAQARSPLLPTEGCHLG